MALFVLGCLTTPGKAQFIPEPCPEGLYRDLSSEPSECRYLDFPFFGASPSIPGTEQHLNPAECSRQGIQDALFALSAQGGGTLNVPACSLEIDNPILMPSFTALKGAGAGHTVLFPAAGFSGPLIRVKRATDVRVADMTLDGRDLVRHTMETIYARDVLMERLEVKRVRQNGLIFNQSRHVSVRYSAFHDIDVEYSFNGIGAKDCYPDRGDTDEASCETQLKTLAQNDFNNGLECATSYCPCDMSSVGEGPGYCFGYGTQFTTGYQVYSNTFRGIANDYCIALHARHGEVAGNLCEESKRGMKAPDAWDVYVHDNLFRDNELWGFFAYGPIKDIHPRRIRLYRNRFLRHGDVAIRAEGPEGLYLVHNVYEDNCRIPVGYCSSGGDVIVNNYEEFFDGSTRLPQTYICGGSSSEDVLNGSNKIRPFKPLYADSGTCYQVLPIDVVDLSVREASSSLEITWRTENETAVAAFEVEESPTLDPDEAAWTSVGRLEAVGNPTSGAAYRWVMASADLDLTHRFRVKQINLDGAVFFSPFVEWRPTTPGLLRLAPFYPAPASDRAVSTLVVGEDREVRVDLVGMRGEHLATLFDGRLPAHVPKRLSIEVGTMPAGTVFVVVSDGLHRIVRPLVVTR